MPTEMPPAPSPQGLGNAALTKEAAPLGYTTRVRALLGLPDRSTGIMPLTGPMLSMEFPYVGTDAGEDTLELPDAWRVSTDTGFELLEPSEGKSLNKVESPMESNAVDLSSARPSPEGQIRQERIWSHGERPQGSGQDSPETLGWVRGNQDKENSQFQSQDVVTAMASFALESQAVSPVPIPLATSQGEIRRKTSTAAMKPEVAKPASPPSTIPPEASAPLNNDNGMGMVPGNTVDSLLSTGDGKARVKPAGLSMTVSQTSGAFALNPTAFAPLVSHSPDEDNAVNLSSAKPSPESPQASGQDGPEILGGVTTAWMQELEQRKEQLPRGNQDKEKSLLKSTHLSPFDATQGRLLPEGEEVRVLNLTVLPMEEEPISEQTNLIIPGISKPHHSTVLSTVELSRHSGEEALLPQVAVLQDDVIPTDLSSQNLSLQVASALVSAALETPAISPVPIPLAASEGEIRRKASTAAMKPEVASPASPPSTIPPAEASAPLNNINGIRMVPGNTVDNPLPPGDGKARIKPAGLLMTVPQTSGAFALNPTAFVPLVSHSPDGDNTVNFSSAKPFSEGEGVRVLKSTALPDGEGLNINARRKTSSSELLEHRAGTEPAIVPFEAAGSTPAQSQSESSGQTKILIHSPSSTAGQVLSNHAEVKRHSVTLTPYMDSSFIAR